jgi:fructokinase
MGKQPSIVSFGEVLWDILPTGKMAGGAPMNFACHARSLGCNVQMISAVGNDNLGSELLVFLENKGVLTDFIQTNYTFPTGTVKVHLNENGAASYEILQPVAWDYISLDQAKIEAVKRADLFLFGSLIARDQYSRKTLFDLLDKAQKTVFDVNLRPPFYSQGLIESILSKIDILKVNDDELDVIAGWYGASKEFVSQMEFLMDKFGIETIVMTKGKHGAFCRHGKEFIFQDSFQVKVQDTVGAGDAFLAAFISKMLYGNNWQDCLEFACATGALVATKSGGTPQIDETEIETFIKERKTNPNSNME